MITKSTAGLSSHQINKPTSSAQVQSLFSDPRSRDGNKTYTHLQPVKSAPFKIRKWVLNGHGASMGKMGKDTGTSIGIGLNTPNPPYPYPFCSMLKKNRSNIFLS